MKTITNKTQLQGLEEELQQQLYQAGFEITPFKIRCTLKSETLLVICEHPETRNLNAKRILLTLQNALSESPVENVQQVGLCLKLEEQTQPYAFHSFPLKTESESGETLKAEPLVPGETENLEETPPATEPSEDDSSDLAILNDLSQNPFDPHDLELLLSEPELPSNPVAPAPLSAPPPVTFSRPKSPSAPKILAIAAVTCAVLLGGIYALTRPCVIGECDALEQAQKLNQQYAQTLEAATSIPGAKEAQQQLQEAIDVLESVPVWSIHYPKLRLMLNGYQEEASSLDGVIAALQTATAAAEQSKNPPHTAQEWTQIKTLWKEAISQLEQVPPNSVAYNFAQKKLDQYQGHFGSVEQRLDAEAEGEKILTAAKKAAQIAEARAGVAQFVDSWRLIIATWKTSLNLLEEVPANTTAYQEAQDLLVVYQQELAKIEQRVRIEEIGAEAYNQAINSALQAQAFERRNTWAQAAASWQRAVNAAKQVPASSAYGVQIQPLLKSYEVSWQRAQVQQKTEARLLKANQDLSKTCSGSPKVCNYTVGSDLIIVRLTPEYMKKVQDPNPQNQAVIKKHVNTLGLALQAISENSQVPVELYDPTGKQIDAHIP